MGLTRLLDSHSPRPESSLWKPAVLLGLSLLSVPSYGADPAGPVLRMCPEAKHAALVELKLGFPQRMTLASFNTTVRDAPGTEGKVLKRLPRGTEVEAVGWAKGSEVRNNCDASPYDGCIDLSDAWVEVSLPGKDGGRGFLSAINVPAPAALACPTVPFAKLAHVQPYDGEDQQYGPAPAPGHTVFDEVGLDHFLTLPVSDNTVQLTRRQLELFVRRQPKGRLQYVPSSKETEYTALQALMADVELQPALPAFIVQGRKVVRLDLGRLEVVGPQLTWGEEEFYSGPASVGSEANGESLPLHRREVSFRLPSAPEGVEVLILTTPEGAQALARGKAKVSRKKVVEGKKKHQQDIVTRELVLVDFDGDGEHELVREDRTIELYSEGEGAADQLCVRLGYGGAWHKLVYPRWADHGL